MKLIDLPSGRVSLEVRPDEVDVVMNLLRARGGLSRVRHATHDEIVAAGHRFVYLDEWDEPCFISTDPPGDHVLREFAPGDDRQARVA